MRHHLKTDLRNCSIQKQVVMIGEIRLHQRLLWSIGFRRSVSALSFALRVIDTLSNMQKDFNLCTENCCETDVLDSLESETDFFTCKHFKLRCPDFSCHFASNELISHQFTVKAQAWRRSETWREQLIRCVLYHLTMCCNTVGICSHVHPLHTCMILM